RTVPAPGKGVIDDHGLERATGIIAPVKREIAARAAHAVSEMCIAPDRTPRDALGIGIEQQLVGIEAVSLPGVIGAMDPIPVELSGGNVRQEAMPDIVGPLRQRYTLKLATPLGVEQA